jgi:hypothetical protein
MTKHTGLSLALGFLTSITTMHAAAACSATTTISALVALGSTGCQIDDTLYNNFSYTPGAGAPVASLVLANQDENSAVFLSGWTFTSSTGSFDGNFTLGFTAAVVTAGAGSCATCLIVSDTEQINSGTTAPGPQTDSVLLTPGGTVSLNNTTVGNETGQTLFSPGISSVTKLATSGAFTMATPLVSFESDIRQNMISSVPEPATFSLLGAGLLGLGLLRRRTATR